MLSRANVVAVIMRRTCIVTNLLSGEKIARPPAPRTVRFAISRSADAGKRALANPSRRRPVPVRELGIVRNTRSFFFFFYRFWKILLSLVLRLRNRSATSRDTHYNTVSSVPATAIRRGLSSEFSSYACSIRRVLKFLILAFYRVRHVELYVYCVYYCKKKKRNIAIFVSVARQVFGFRLNSHNREYSDIDLLLFLVKTWFWEFPND